MKQIEKVLICGLGALGSFCASKIYENKSTILKIVLDETRYKRYKDNPTIFNDKQYLFDYILPTEKNYQADLVIIATKADGLDSAIKNIKPFTTEETIILSLLNGIHSEKKLEKEIKSNNILTSFYLGTSCIRTERQIQREGKYSITIGTNKKEQEKAILLTKDFFEKIGINYNIAENIEEEYWKKFIINSGINQLTAATQKDLIEIKKDKDLINSLKQLMYEAMLCAKFSGIKNYKKLYNEAEKFLLEEVENVTPSMMQDIKNGRRTEVDIFAGEIIKICQSNKINAKENEKIYKVIKNLEKNML